MENQINNRLPEENENEQNGNDSDAEQQRTSAGSDHKKHSSAASIDSIIGSATNNVRSRRHSGDWSNTGTNISYEGPTAPGGGGSVGSGQASGQSATEQHMSTDSEYDKAHIANEHRGRDEDLDPEEDSNRQEKDII